VKRTINASIVILFIVCNYLSVNAENRHHRTTANTHPGGIRGELLLQLDDAEEKLLSLAQAVPQEKYTWRPQKGVRSISEVYMHIADGTSRLLRNADFEPPAILDDDYLEQITDKEKVINLLKLALEHTRDAIIKTPDAKMNIRTTLLGKRTTYRGVFLQVITHMHEHLGQSIAYARMNDIVPPWTAKEMQQQEKSK